MVVQLALSRLLTESDDLDSQTILEQQVYVAGHLSPESFSNPAGMDDGAVLLRFVRPTALSAWRLDETQFLILEDQ